MVKYKDASNDKSSLILETPCSMLIKRSEKVVCESLRPNWRHAPRKNPEEQFRNNAVEFKYCSIV